MSINTTTQASGQVVVYLPRYITPGKNYCARIVGTGLSGRWIYYQISDENGRPVLQSKTCGVAGGATIYINVPGPGKYYVSAVVSQDQCDYTQMEGYYEVQVLQGFPFIAPVALYVCINRTYSIDCTKDNADLVTLAVPNARIPLALSPVLRISGLAESVGALTQLAIYKDGKVLSVVGLSQPFVYDTGSTECSMDLPQIYFPLTTPTTYLGTFAFGIRFAIYVYATMVMLNQNIPLEKAMLMAGSALMIDKLAEDMFPLLPGVNS